MRTSLPASGLLLFACISAFLPRLALSGPVPKGYALVWSDEFDKDGPPDPTKWVAQTGFLRNEEAQWYQAENAFCRDGLLVIEARKERKPNPNYERGSDDWRRNRPMIEYTSACLVTQGVHSWRYGRFEVRARIVAEEGLWPAIWFLGVEGKWPQRGEIDLMEYYGGNVLANACWKGVGKGAKWDASKTPVADLGGAGWAEQFHVWRMEWDERVIALCLDVRLLNTIELDRTINPEGVAPRNPFHQPHYLLLNLALGGTNGGNLTRTRLPSRYEIDYVRIFQRTPEVPKDNRQ